MAETRAESVGALIDSLRRDVPRNIKVNVVHEAFQAFVRAQGSSVRTQQQPVRTQQACPVCAARKMANKARRKKARANGKAAEARSL